MNHTRTSRRHFLRASLFGGTALLTEVRLYGRQSVEAHLEASGKNFIENLDPNGLKVLNSFVEPSLTAAEAGDKFKFERHGNFVVYQVDHAARETGV